MDKAACDSKPHFEHDLCNECHFIGHYKWVDIWSHDEQGDGAVIARYSSDGGAYESGSLLVVAGEQLQPSDFERITRTCAEAVTARAALAGILSSLAQAGGHPAPPSRPSPLAASEQPSPNLG